MVYSLKNTLNNTIYIGQSNHHLISRWKKHLERAFSMQKRDHLKSALLKYGLGNFKFEILQICRETSSYSSIEHLNAREIFYINHLSKNHKLYNKSMGGNFSTKIIINWDKVVEFLKPPLYCTKSWIMKYGLVAQFGDKYKSIDPKTFKSHLNKLQCTNVFKYIQIIDLINKNKILHRMRTPIYYNFSISKIISILTKNKFSLRFFEENFFPEVAHYTLNNQIKNYIKNLEYKIEILKDYYTKNNIITRKKIKSNDINKNDEIIKLNELIDKFERILSNWATYKNSKRRFSKIAPINKINRNLLWNPILLPIYHKNDRDFYEHFRRDIQEIHLKYPASTTQKYSDNEILHITTSTAYTDDYGACSFSLKQEKYLKKLSNYAYEQLKKRKAYWRLINLGFS